jgi:DNA polymerase
MDELKCALNSKCRRCGLRRTTSRVCVSGRGNVNPRILLLGEAPGANEEKTGKIFSGRAGKLLTSILMSLDMLSYVYITNAVKCRPPGNRTPNGTEIGKCRIYFDRELKILKPRVIVLMGRVAISSFGYGREVRAGTRGFKFDEWWIKPTWHPSYCCRMGKSATADLRRALLFAKSKRRSTC